MKYLRRVQAVKDKTLTFDWVVLIVALTGLSVTAVGSIEASATILRPEPAPASFVLGLPPMQSGMSDGMADLLARIWP